jgi:hypothetical protein
MTFEAFDLQSYFIDEEAGALTVEAAPNRENFW